MAEERPPMPSRRRLLGALVALPSLIAAGAAHGLDMVSPSRAWNRTASATEVAIDLYAAAQSAADAARRTVGNARARLERESLPHPRDAMTITDPERIAALLPGEPSWTTLQVGRRGLLQYFADDPAEMGRRLAAYDEWMVSREANLAAVREAEAQYSLAQQARLEAEAELVAAASALFDRPAPHLRATAHKMATAGLMRNMGFEGLADAGDWVARFEVLALADRVRT